MDEEALGAKWGGWLVGLGNLLILIIYTLILFTGCGPKGPLDNSQNESQGTAHWPLLPVEIYADEKIRTTPGAEHDLIAALEYWEQKTSRTLFVYKGVWRGQTVHGVNELVRVKNSPVNLAIHENPWPYSSSVLAVTIRLVQGAEIQRAIITLNDNLNLCFDNCLHRENGVNFRKLLAHEVGHFIGLDHSDERKNVMYAFYQPDLNLDEMQVDWNALTKVLP